MINKLLFLILLLTVSVSTFATTVKNLYEVSVPVFSQSSKERKAATVKAFEELLIRVTGKTDIAEQEAGAKLLKNARRYIRSFRYESIERKIAETPVPVAEEFFNEVEQFSAEDLRLPTELVVLDVEEPKPEQKLVIIFDEKAVKKNLWKSKLPVWGKTRPATLLWIAVQEEQVRRLIDASEPLLLLEHVSKYAQRRGVPILYPLLDLEDQMNLNVSDVWGGFKESLTQASERYQPEAVVAVRLEQDSFGIWKSRWSFYQGSEELRWITSTLELEAAIKEGIDHLANKLAVRYAHVPTSGDENSTFVYVSDVASLSDYDKVSRYFKSLSAVKKVFVSQVQVNDIVYQLDLRGSKQALKQAISLSNVLNEIEDPFAIDLPESRFNYRLMP